MVIYKITNKINGKSYIGQTVQRLSDRYYRHKRNAFKDNYNTPLYNAMRKYGINNFTVEEIGGANNITELNYQEFLLIYKNDTMVPNGYNLKEGGYNTRLDGCTKKKISNTLKKVIKKEHMEKMRQKSLDSIKRPVVVEDTKTGKLLKFSSIKDTSILGSHKHINDILTGRRPYNIYKKRYWILYEGEISRRGQ